MTVRPDGSDWTYLTHYPAGYRANVGGYSPDGQWIVFRLEGPGLGRRAVPDHDLPARSRQRPRQRGAHVPAAEHGDVGRRCADLMQTINSPKLRSAFDFANFVIAGERPRDNWPLLKPFTDHIHVKDAVMGTGEKMVPAGQAEFGQEVA